MSLVVDLKTHGWVGRKVFVVILLMISTIGIIAALFGIKGYLVTMKYERRYSKKLADYLTLSGS